MGERKTAWTCPSCYRRFPKSADSTGRLSVQCVALPVIYSFFIPRLGVFCLFFWFGGKQYSASRLVARVYDRSLSIHPANLAQLFSLLCFAFPPPCRCTALTFVGLRVLAFTYVGAPSSDSQKKKRWLHTHTHPFFFLAPPLAFRVAVWSSLTGRHKPRKCLTQVA